MAYKVCSYCCEPSDKNQQKCPYCKAPLENKVVFEDGNFFDGLNMVASKITKTVSGGSTVSTAKSVVSGVGGVVNEYKTSRADAKASAPKKRLVNKYLALILVIFFGLTGAHRYYEGKIKTGILYTLTCGLFFIGALIDFFIILGKPMVYSEK